MKKLLLIISLAFFIGGCGSKGALYLPPGGSPESAVGFQ
ncbi:LPS translocon maturation chaperone LptM [Coxiella burnetii]